MPEETILNSIDAKDVIATLGKGSEFEGKLTFDGVVKVDGRFSGEIFSKGTLIVGQNAEIRAEISVSSVVIQGRVVGNVVAPNCVELHAPARLTGNITTPCLFIEKGVVFEGSTLMDGDKPQAADPAIPRIPATPPRFQ